MIKIVFKYNVNVIMGLLREKGVIDLVKIDVGLVIKVIAEMNILGAFQMLGVRMGNAGRVSKGILGMRVVRVGNVGRAAKETKVKKEIKETKEVRAVKVTKEDKVTKPAVARMAGPALTANQLSYNHAFNAITDII